jgi:hypothetical protein
MGVINHWLPWMHDLFIKLTYLTIINFDKAIVAAVLNSGLVYFVWFWQMVTSKGPRIPKRLFPVNRNKSLFFSINKLLLTLLAFDKEGDTEY